MGVDFSERNGFFEAMACLSVALHIDPRRMKTYRQAESVQAQMTQTGWSQENDDMYEEFCLIVDTARRRSFNELYANGIADLRTHSWEAAGNNLCQAGDHH